MFGLLKSALGMDHPVDFGNLLSLGAQIIDVRSKEEFAGGHIQGAINIPLQNFADKMTTIRKDKPVIVCCASGARSSSAARILKSSGYLDVHNGGGWRGLQRKMVG